MVNSMRNRNLSWVALVCVAALVVVGCAEKQSLIPVSGKVLIDGKPVTKGSIQFVPEKGRPYASKILEDGSFRLADLSVSKDRLPGVSEGKYRIGISSAEVVNEDSGVILRQIPAHYADFKKSDLELEITEPQENLLIELTWEGFEEVEEDEEAAEDADDQAGEEAEDEVSEESQSAEPGDQLSETDSEGSANDTSAQQQEAIQE